MISILSVGALRSWLHQHNQVLRKAGFSVYSCSCPLRARRLFAKGYRCEILLIAHTTHPKQRQWLLEQVREVSPRTRTVFLSSCALDYAGMVDVTLAADATPERLVTAITHLANAKRHEAPALTHAGKAFIIAARILYVAASEGAAAVRQGQLKEAGYSAHAAVGVQETEFACDNNRYDLVIIGSAIGPRLKSRIADAVWQRQPTVRILETGTSVANVDGANCTAGVSIQEVLKAAQSLLRKRRAGIRHRSSEEQTASGNAGSGELAISLPGAR